VNRFIPQNLNRIYPKLSFIFPWIIAFIGGFLVLLLFLVQSGLVNGNFRQSIWLPAGLGVFIGGILYFLTRSLLRSVHDRELLTKKTIETEKKAEETNQLLVQFIRLNEKFSKAKEEKEIIDALVQSCVEVSGSSGGSYVPLDDRGLPMVAESFGEYPTSAISSWIDYLTSPAVRNLCRKCSKFETNIDTCPLLAAPFSDAVTMYCLPLKRFGIEIGILNLYLGKNQKIEENAQSMIKTMLNGTALALEGIRLRKEKLDALNQIQALHSKIDLESQFSTLLKKFCGVLESDYAILIINNRTTGGPELHVTVGDYLNPKIIPVELLWQKSVTVGGGFIISPDMCETYSMREGSTAIITPIEVQDNSLYGVIIVGNNRQSLYDRFQLALLESFALSIDFLIQTSNIQPELEFNAMMAERTRLAREIHDGLAQTLGFLKMQSIQMQDYLARGDINLLQQSLDKLLKILTEVYQETRQSIDGLRISPKESRVISWLEQIAEDFRENSGMDMELINVDCIEGLSPEVQAQLIRIFQEALSNIRKHAKATQVRILCSKNAEDLILEGT
jgi:two-component system, NarL family, nitrate/nitrite sensor histidine kinase NarX